MLSTIGFSAVPEREAAPISQVCGDSRRWQKCRKEQPKGWWMPASFFKDLFQKEMELVMAENAQVEAENRALAKEKLASTPNRKAVSFFWGRVRVSPRCFVLRLGGLSYQ